MRLKMAVGVAAAVVAWSAGVGAGPAAAQADVASIAAVAGFESARTYFDRGRKLGFPAAGQSSPYVLKAEFTTRGSSGAVETGTYTDTWVSDTKWRREAVLGKSQFVRSQNGKKRYRVAEGPDAELLQFVLTVMEPIPASDSVREADWAFKREAVGGVPTVRVATGAQDADGKPDPKDFHAYWFDETGQLVKSYGNGMETRRSEFGDFNGVKVARRVEVLLANKVGMRINVMEVGPAGRMDSHIFTIKRHDWVRQATSEVR